MKTVDNRSNGNIGLGLNSLFPSARHERDLNAGHPRKFVKWRWWDGHLSLDKRKKNSFLTVPDKHCQSEIGILMALGLFSDRGVLRGNWQSATKQTEMLRQVLL